MTGVTPAKGPWSGAFTVAVSGLREVEGVRELFVRLTPKADAGRVLAVRRALRARARVRAKVARAGCGGGGLTRAQMLPVVTEGARDTIVLNIPPGTLTVAGAKGDDVVCEISLDRVKMTSDGKGMVLLPA